MPQTPLTRRQGGLLVKMIIIGMVVQLSVVVYVGLNQRAGCERGKLDRKDNSDFQNAQTTYIDKVVLAKSVRGDVKQAARTAVRTFNRTSESLSRRSKIDCDIAFLK